MRVEVTNHKCGGVRIKGVGKNMRQGGFVVANGMVDIDKVKDCT